MQSNQVKEKQTILIAEDEPEIRSYLEMALKCEGYAVEMAHDGEEALGVLRDPANPVSAVLLDIVMPRRDGLEALREIRKMDPDLPVIMVSGASSTVNVVEAMKIGATDFLSKPVSHEDLLSVLRRIDLKRHVSPFTEPDDSSPEPSAKEAFIGSSHPEMQEIESLVGKIGWSEAPVLINGETGSGKEVLARRLHQHSPRAKKPFLKLNCAALPSELVESELFGYERGAFTGAFQKKPGMFELADGGTILLDEIGDMDFKLQAKLLQVLQDHEFQRLGGRETIRVDVRVIAATHCDLEKAIAENKFREDLYYRLNVIHLRVPPLRERTQDILPLADLLMRKHSGSNNALPVISPSLREALQMYDWPGNIRELENVVRKLLVLRDPDAVARDLFARANRLQARRSNASIDLDKVDSSGAILEQVSQAKRNAERTAILAALNTTRWNRKKAASLLKIDYKALLYKMKKLGIDERPAESASSGEEEAIPAGQADLSL